MKKDSNLKEFLDIDKSHLLKYRIKSHFKSHSKDFFDQLLTKIKGDDFLSY